MEFPSRKNKCKTFCSVYNCTSKACRDDDKRFYHFPPAKQSVVKITNKFGNEEEIDRREAWIMALKMGKKVTPSMRICSLHFLKEDFIPSRGNKICHLKKTSIPSLNLPVGSIKKDPNSKLEREAIADARKERIRNRSLVKQTQNKTEVPSDTTAGTSNASEHSSETVTVEEKQKEVIELGDTASSTTKENELIPELNAEPIEDENATINVVKTLVDVGVQVQSDYITSKFSALISCDSELTTLTGIQSFQILNTIEKLVRIVKPQDSYTKLNLREAIAMTFMRLKQNMSYSLLAFLFHCCTPETCKDRIFEMLDILNICLKPAIFWPTKANVRKNVPRCFTGFEDVRVVIDCTEIPIQRSKSLCCQIVTYSHYKSTYTVKFLTGVTPGGLISFVSKPYGGRASDNAIFEQSEIIKKLDKKDAIMADRGFTVDDLCKKHDVKLIRPSFLKNKKQLSASEAISSRSIARARVHVERSNQRLKTFDVLSTKMPVCLLPKVEEIFNVICAVVNLSTPILANDKF